MSRPDAPDPGLRALAEVAEEIAQSRLDLASRLALRPREAAEALGISERTFRALLPQIPHFREGNMVLVPVKALEAWLETRAAAEGERTDRIADEVLGELDGAS